MTRLGSCLHSRNSTEIPWTAVAGPCRAMRLQAAVACTATAETHVVATGEVFKCPLLSRIYITIDAGKSFKLDVNPDDSDWGQCRCLVHGSNGAPAADGNPSITDKAVRSSPNISRFDSLSRDMHQAALWLGLLGDMLRAQPCKQAWTHQQCMVAWRSARRACSINNPLSA